MEIGSEKKFHINLSQSDCGSVAIMPGDPGRVEKIAEKLDDPHFVASKREYCTWAGYLNNKKIIVTSTGIGGPSAAIAVHELAECGITTMLRVGTCGGMNLKVCGGDLVIATGAIRGDGVTLEYLPLEFPAVPDLEVLNALVESAKLLSEDSDGLRFHTGVVQSKDSFYSQISPETKPVAEHLQNRWKSYIRGGCLASEMESSTLFLVGQCLGLKTGAVFTVLWNQERENAGLPNQICDNSERAIKTTVAAAARLLG